MRAVLDDPFFIPAESLGEALGRIHALTGRAPSASVGGTRAGKRALVALRDSLELDVDVVRTPAAMGKAIASHLDIVWTDDRFVVKNMVTLDGFNALLEGATRAFYAGSLRQLKDEAPVALRGEEWDAFEPARSKIEAVTRIAALTNAPRETLGPGSKEHKSVFVNLADALFPGDSRIDKSSKTRLGASLASVLNVPWTDDCASTGETIQLPGLNTILAGAERKLGRLGAVVSDMLATPEAEGDALAAALQAGLPNYWDGRKSVKWLADNSLRGANDNEWQGFFGEQRARQVLGAAYQPKVPGPRVKYGNTVFDYSLNWVWDIKVHVELQRFPERVKTNNGAMWLNDEQAVWQCVQEQGLGFLTISGAAEMDADGEFVVWHREFKAAATGKAPAPSNSGISRIRKSAFTPLHVEAFWIPNPPALSAAIAGGEVRVQEQPPQAPKKAGERGATREPKFMMNVRKARRGIRVARHDWPAARQT
ncbi:hypothetical protein ACIO3S_05040 [Nocardioides sp. NPDC087217]|uniref:hypothetical protein n=1 Tax=Nocardioides sp. NPDC087217 TaxID=3364335 RepID=UPI00380DD492